MKSAATPWLASILLVGVAALGYWVYETQRQPQGVEISVGRGGVSIQQK